MPTNYILKQANSDLSGGLNFNKELSEDIEAAGSFSITVQKGATQDSYGFTVAGEPGTKGGSGAQSYTIEQTFATANTAVNLSVAVERVDSAGTVIATSAFSAEQACTGTLTFTVTADLGVFAAGDRLGVVYRHVNTNAMTNQSLAIETGTINTETIAPWSPPPAINTDAAFNMATPPGTITSTQTIRARIYNDGGKGSPTGTLYYRIGDLGTWTQIWNGTVTGSEASPTLIEPTFDGTGLDGNAMQLRFEGIGVSGGTPKLHSLEWLATYTPFNKPFLETTWGVNLAVAEFGDETNIPGVLDTDYTYPTAEEMAYYGGKGLDVVRVPFRWERVHRNAADGSLEATLHETDMLRLDKVIADAQANNMQVLLDMHNYARRFEGGVTKFIGRDIPYANFANVWKLIANRYKANTGIFGYGLMNEPNGIPPIPGTFTGTVLHNFDDGTTQGWQDSNATHVTTPVYSGTGAVRFTKLAADIPAGTGYTNLRPFVSSPTTAPGSSLRCFIRKPASTGGVWRARVEWQDTAFAWNTTAPLIELVDDTWVEISHDFGTIGTVHAFGIQIETNDAPDNLDAVFYMDDFSQGSIEGGTAAENVWPTAAQEATDAIRTVDTTHQIFVGGDNWSGAHSWRTYNENLRINDSANKLVYEAHQYFDNDSSGKYVGTYVQEGATPTTGVDRVQPFLDWCVAKDVNGYIGEYGNPKDADWLTVQKNFLDHLKANGMGSTYWAGGPWWYNSTTGVDYPLSIEPIDNFVTDKPQMDILEAYLPAQAIVKNASVTLDSSNAMNIDGARDKVVEVSANMASDVAESSLRERVQTTTITSGSDLVLADITQRFRTISIAVESGLDLATIVERARAVGISLDTNVVDTVQAVRETLASIGIVLDTGTDIDAVIENLSQVGITFSTDTILDYSRERTRETLLTGDSTLDNIVGTRVRTMQMTDILDSSLTASRVIDRVAGTSLALATAILSNSARIMYREATINTGSFMQANVGAVMVILAQAGIDTTTLTTIDSVIEKSKEIGLNFTTDMSVAEVRERARELGITTSSTLTLDTIRERLTGLSESLTSDVSIQSVRETARNVGISLDTQLIASTGVLRTVLASLTMQLATAPSAEAVIDKAREVGVHFESNLTLQEARDKLNSVGIDGDSTVEIVAGRVRATGLAVQTGSVIEALAQRWRHPTVNILGSTETIVFYEPIEYIKPGVTIQIRQLVKSDEVSVKYPTEVTTTKVRQLIVADVQDNEITVIEI